MLHRLLSVTNFLKKEDTKPAAKAEKAVTKAEDAKTEEGKERPKKKSSITAVFNAQYSKQSRRPGQGNGNNNRNNRDNNRGSRRDNGQQRPEQHSIIRPRPVGERAMRPISERTASNVDDLQRAVQLSRMQKSRITVHRMETVRIVRTVPMGIVRRTETVRIAKIVRIARIVPMEIVHRMEIVRNVH